MSSATLDPARSGAILAALDTSGDLPAAPGAADHERRRARLGALLEEAGADALFVEPGATARYLAGLEWRPSERLFGAVVTRGGEVLVVAPSFERDVLERVLPPDATLVLWDEHEYGYAELATELAAREVGTLLVDPGVRTLLTDRLATAFDGTLASGADVVRRLRAVKDAGELAIMDAAQGLTKRAIGHVAAHVEPGMTCAQVAALMHAAQQKLGLQSTWDLTLVGPDAADPHGHTNDTEIAAGDLLLCDTGGTLFGYHSDCTRTWVVGEPKASTIDDYRRAWDTVFAAQDAALAAFRAGQPCGGVDRAARAVIEKAGYGDGYAAFSHRLGHGIGTEIHEPPYCDGGSDVPLEVGMCFSNEPGIYLPGKFGLRIEDIVQVTADGARTFGPRQRGVEAPF
jgi:Xaa-Pro dipeptidase